MKAIALFGLLWLTMMFVVACDDEKNGRETAESIAASIKAVCGTTENREAGGPRTITPMDVDGEYGPSGYLVTCVNGRVEYVKAEK